MKFWEIWNRRDELDWDKVLVNGEKTFNGTGKEFMDADFEIVKEKKTLSDKRLPNKFCDEECKVVGEWKYKELDVKEALKEFMDWLDPKNPYSKEHIEKAKEIFGKELI